jgi:hypothetical protein
VPEAADPWTWWRNSLAGTVGPITTTPEQGYFRVRAKNGQWEPVAIWFDEDRGDWIAFRNNREVHADDIWIAACRYPITLEQYDKAIEGGGFDDEPARAPTVSHNSADIDPLEALRIEYLGEAEMAEEFLRHPIRSRDDASKVAIWSKRLADIARKANDLHRVEKQPSLDEVRRVDERWRELRDAPKALSARLKRHSDDYLLEQERIERERQRRAREDADRARREAEAAAHAARHADVLEDDDTAAARQEEINRLQQEAARAETEAEGRRVQAGRTGAKLSLRTFVTARIIDFDVLLGALKNRPEIHETVQSLANRAARSGVDLPGMERVEERRSV